MEIKRYDILIQPDRRRVLYLPFEGMTRKRVIKIIARIQMLNDQEVRRKLDEVISDFHKRHSHLLHFFYRQYDRVSEYVISDRNLTEERKLLIGAYFTQEYSMESSALFNPSMIWHCDQSGLAEGERRFILSLRATGEGHISSITFRSGIIDKNYAIRLDEPSPFVTLPEHSPNRRYEKNLFLKKMSELGLIDEFSESAMSELPDPFTLPELTHTIDALLRKSRRFFDEHRRTATGMITVAQSNYEVRFTPEQDISERVIYPSTQAEANGIEDARFVEFHDLNGAKSYYALYTAFNGKIILPQMLQTDDFLCFRISTLNGPAVQNKGMALFPRRINGRYAMLSRQDNENIYCMFSDNIHFWYSKKIVMKPEYEWEFVQIGNCGSPIETEKGWLVLTHGVGPMRKYVISACLLDLDDPTRVVGRLKRPLLEPNDNEREGYVPNVVYSCGGQIFGERLIIPYAMSDYASTFASVELKDLLDEMTTR